MPNIQINGKSLYYYASEPQQEPLGTLLLIHGLGSSSSFYFPMTAYLKSGIRFIAMDTAGSGSSELGKSELSISSIVEDAIKLLDVLGVDEKVTVVGHSMGGIVASQLAVSYSSRVNAVVLIGPVNPSAAMAQVFEDRIQTIKRDGLEALAESVPQAATGASATALQRAFIRNLILRTQSEGYMALCSVIARAPKPDYAAITIPLMVIAGSDDKTAPLEGCQTIYNSYSIEPKHKKIVELSKVGHWHCIEAGELVAGAINTFVDDQST